MYPITSVPNRLAGGQGGLEQRVMRVELPDTDAATVESLNFDALPNLGPGDRVLIKSPAATIYRRVVRVEPIAGGGALVWLDSGYIVRRERGDITI